jgi:hypothetical protein
MILCIFEHVQCRWALMTDSPRWLGDLANGPGAESCCSSKILAADVACAAAADTACVEATAGADTSSGCTKVMIFLTDGVNSGRWAAQPTRPTDSAPDPNLSPGFYSRSRSELLYHARARGLVCGGWGTRDGSPRRSDPLPVIHAANGVRAYGDEVDDAAVTRIFTFTFGQKGELDVALMQV